MLNCLIRLWCLWQKAVQWGRSQDTDLTQTGENILTMMFLVCPSPSYGLPVAQLCCEQCHLERLVEEDHMQDSCSGASVPTEKPGGWSWSCQSLHKPTQFWVVLKCKLLCDLGACEYREQGTSGEGTLGHHGPADQGVKVFTSVSSGLGSAVLYSRRFGWDKGAFLGRGRSVSKFVLHTFSSHAVFPSA